MRKRVRTYRAGADKCGASAERVATMGRAPHDDRSAAHYNGSTAHNNGYAAHDDKY